MTRFRKSRPNLNVNCRPDWAEVAHFVLHGRAKCRESEFLKASPWKNEEIRVVEKGGHLDRPIQFDLRRWSPCPPPYDPPPSPSSSPPSSFPHSPQSSPPSLITRYTFLSSWSLHFFPLQLARKWKMEMLISIRGNVLGLTESFSHWIRRSCYLLLNWPRSAGSHVVLDLGFWLSGCRNCYFQDLDAWGWDGGRGFWIPCLIIYILKLKNFMNFVWGCMYAIFFSYRQSFMSEKDLWSETKWGRMGDLGCITVFYVRRDPGCSLIFSCLNPMG